MPLENQAIGNIQESIASQGFRAQRVKAELFASKYSALSGNLHSLLNFGKIKHPPLNHKGMEVGNGLKEWTMVSLKRKPMGFRYSQLNSYFLYCTEYFHFLDKMRWASMVSCYFTSPYDLMVGV